MKGGQGTRRRLTASMRCSTLLLVSTEPSEMASLSRATSPSCHPIRSGCQCPPWLVCWTLSGAFVRGVELPCAKFMGEGEMFTGYPDLLWSHVLLVKDLYIRSNHEYSCITGFHAWTSCWETSQSTCSLYLCIGVSPSNDESDSRDPGYFTKWERCCQKTVTGSLSYFHPYPPLYSGGFVSVAWKHS